jgi:hypothetical protein
MNHWAKVCKVGEARGRALQRLFAADFKQAGMLPRPDLFFKFLILHAVPEPLPKARRRYTHRKYSHLHLQSPSYGDG